MVDTLARILAEKRTHIEARKTIAPPAEIKRQAQARADAPRGFAAALRGHHGVALIAEIKKASPSRGLIRADFDPARLAALYAESGAACLSILTDEPFFQGRDEYLRQARAATTLPVLRKDFMIDPYQVYESRALGADCILLILAALSQEEAHELEERAQDLGMDVLIETHDEAELERALAMRSPLIGVNNRNLKTLEVDLSTSERLLGRLPADRIGIAESGFSTHEEILALKRKGARAFLVGESLMKAQDVGLATRRLLGASA
ncbi:MAG TPA: indole-3-glycerol phosphate synthase TrpC [Dongiaceae bacterium]|jgi:indole-3-glycerol phosphate synthase|nr:indole-3-glycerol phosphate synthase TrpC [Dongiaceae bacterium]